MHPSPRVLSARARGVEALPEADYVSFDNPHSYQLAPRFVYLFLATRHAIEPGLAFSLSPDDLHTTLLKPMVGTFEE